MKRKKKSLIQPVHHVVCVAGYYDPDADEPHLVRVTAVVTDLRTNDVVDRLEASGEDDEDTFSTAIAQMARKYRAELVRLSNPVPLEMCECGKHYLDQYISRDSWEAMHNQDVASMN